jgi:hypothetical protein
VYVIAGVLMLIGVVLWAITYAINLITGSADSEFDDVEKLGD